MKQFFYFTALSVLAIAMAACATGTSTSASSSQDDTAAVVEVQLDSTLEPQEKASQPETNDIADDEQEAPQEDSRAGITFRTFTHKSFEDAYEKRVVVQSALENSRVVRNLKELGFTLADKKTERRADYTGTEYYNATIETYNKTINGQTTSVLLEEDQTIITFPSDKDAQEFFSTAKASGLKQHGNQLEDNPDVYWTGTDVKISGNVVTLTYRWEP